ncbi:MAG: tryptophan-rich sensory protein [Coleofasciculus sp. G1-WW12-02]|uniref:tryptophan-rich sensory protein n=1 Tax=Coleofasciculus sp. G1-WW12-02 TaxID=3068483 RepID=UPI0032F6A138
MKQFNSLNPDRLRQVLTLSAILAAFGINIWANIAPIGGLTIGEISNTIFGEIKIIPASYAFAIWGIIYLGLISLGIYQVLPNQEQNPHLRQMGYSLVLASFAQIAWVFLFQYRQFALSLVAMLGILVPLIRVYLRLGIGSVRVSRKQKWYVHIPVSIYLAWISVATILNVAIVLYDLGWSGWGIDPSAWTAIALIVGAVITATVIIQRSDIAFPLVIAWAYIAIALRHTDTPLISGVAGGFAIALLLFAGLKHYRH